MRQRQLRLYSTFFVFVITVQVLFYGLSAGAQISHLELGAANYGSEYGTSEKQFLVLEQTFKDLIKKFGPTGVIYLNDLSDTDLKVVHEWTLKWLTDNNYLGIKIVDLPGNYNEVDVPMVKTAHLTNPELIQLVGKWNYALDEKSQLVSKLEKIAEHSETGLAITTYFYSKENPGIWDIPRFLKNSLLMPTGKKGYYYYYGNGDDPKNVHRDLETSEPLIFLILPRNICTTLLESLNPKMALDFTP